MKNMLFVTRQFKGFGNIMNSRQVRRSLGVIALAMALGLPGCASQQSSGVVVSDCNAYWTRDGFDHYRFSVKNNGGKTIGAATILLGTYEPGIPETGTDGMSTKDFTKIAGAMLPFEYSGSVESGQSRNIEVRTTNRRDPKYVGPLTPRRASCVVSEVTYTDQTHWSHDVHIGFTGLKAPYFTSQPK